ncbi:MAG: CDP-diacylglycerol--serine O-phosphatidyltransferase, partial [Steroidobacteraceae bacterium]
ILGAASRPCHGIRMKVDINDIRTRRGIYLLPNLLTTLCLFGGFYSIIAAIDGNFERAAIAIFVAMIFDGLDGRVARLTGTETVFGKEFDSLADMVAFGVAPAIVCYQWGVARISEYGAAWGRFGWIAAFFFAAATAMRLARFNARSAVQDKRYFEGLPSPSAAAVVAAFIGLAYKYEVTGLPGLILAFVITGLAAILMVSRFPYRSFKDRAAGERVRYSKFLLVPLVIALIAIDPPVVLFVLFSGFALSGPLGWTWLKIRKRPRVTGGPGEAR